MKRYFILLALVVVACAMPASGQVCPSGASWCSGLYSYDGMGNIRAIGSDTYIYDTVGRLVSGTAEKQRSGVSEQDYGYDTFGNRTSASRVTGSVDCLGGCEQAPTIDPLTNHITGNSAAYDAAGNLISITNTVGSTAYTSTYVYDAAGSMASATAGSDVRQFIYTADDERIATRSGQSWTWTVRGLDSKVLREFTSLEPNNSPGLPTSSRQWAKDYVWRDGQLLASVTPSGSSSTSQHFHLDHLGTPRLVSNDNGVQTGIHAYYPFGAELNLSPNEQPSEPMKFTGHERDVLASNPNTLDYMHARFEMGTMGRFLSVDPVLDIKAALMSPQKWNRYAYADNNPITNLDANGRETVVFIVGPGSGSRERGGHAAVWVERNGQHAGISKGGFDLEKYGWKAFLGHYAGEGREVHAYVLNTSAESENAMIKFVKDEGPSAGTSDDRSIATCGLSENCAKGVVNTLQAGGVLPANTDPSAVYGMNSPFVLKGALDTGVLKPVVEQHIDFVPSPPKENWFMRVWHSITQ